MKLKEIILSIGFLTAMFSCSMENDILNDIDNKVDIISEQYAYFNFALKGTNDLASKAATKSSVTEDKNKPATELEASIANCFIAILNGEKVLTFRYYEGNEVIRDKTDKSLYRLNREVFLKAPAGNPTLTCFVVTNIADEAMKSKLYSATTATQLNKIACVGNLEANKLIKVGSIEFSDYNTTPKTIHDVDNNGNKLSSIDGVPCNEVSISVSQRAAAVELVNFTLTNRNVTTNGETDMTASVSDVQLELMNINTQTEIGNAGTPSINAQSSLAGQNVRLYAYGNSTDMKTSFKIHYKVNGEPEETKTFTIKTPNTNGSLTDREGNKYDEKIIASYLYQINVKVINEQVEVSIQCTIKDWNKNSYTLDPISVTNGNK